MGEGRSVDRGKRGQDERLGIPRGGWASAGARVRVGVVEPHAIRRDIKKNPDEFSGGVLAPAPNPPEARRLHNSYEYEQPHALFTFASKTPLRDRRPNAGKKKKHKQPACLTVHAVSLPTRTGKKCSCSPSPSEKRRSTSCKYPHRPHPRRTRTPAVSGGGLRKRPFVNIARTFGHLATGPLFGQKNNNDLFMIEARKKNSRRGNKTNPRSDRLVGGGSL